MRAKERMALFVLTDLGLSVVGRSQRNFFAEALSERADYNNINNTDDTRDVHRINGGPIRLWHRFLAPRRHLYRPKQYSGHSIEFKLDNVVVVVLARVCVHVMHIIHIFD